MQSNYLVIFEKQEKNILDDCDELLVNVQKSLSLQLSSTLTFNNLVKLVACTQEAFLQMKSLNTTYLGSKLYSKGSNEVIKEI